MNEDSPLGNVGRYDLVSQSSRVTKTKPVDLAMMEPLQNTGLQTPTDRCKAAWSEALAKLDEGEVDEFKRIKEDVYGKAKKRLPCVTFCGVFPSQRTALADDFQPSGFLALDFDGDKTRGMALEDAVALRERLRDDPHMFGAFLSPGKGVRAVMRIDIKNDADLKQAWPALQRRYGGHLDEACKDISRLSFLAHDPGAWVRDTWPKPFDWSQPSDPFLEPAPPLPMQPAASVSATPSSQPAPPLPTQPAATPSSKQAPASVSTSTAAEAVQHIRNTVLLGAKLAADDAAVSRHSFMRAASVTAWRYINGGQVTEAEAYAALLDAYTGPSGVFPGSVERADGARRAFYGWGKDKAPARGPLYTTAAPAPARTVETIQRDDLDELLETRVFYPWFDNEPEPVPAVLTFADEVEVGHVGSITAIVASYSAGKSTVATAIWAAYYNEPGDDIDTLGFRVTRPEGRPHAFYIDTEQATRESWQAFKRATLRSNLDADKAPPGMQCTYMNFHNMTNHQRQALLWLYLEDLAAETGGLVILDGSADFISSVINEGEVDEFMQRLRRAASENNICIVLTIHENKGSTFVSPRGHLGSDILRRCSNILTVSKDRKAGLHTIAVEKARSGRSGVDWQFRYDEDAKAHVSTGKRAEEAGKHTLIISRLAGELKHGVTYAAKDIRAILESLDPEAVAATDDARRKTATRIQTAAVTSGILEKAGHGKYRLARPAENEEVLPF